ncbi:MAG: glycoside hydrolase family 13 protein [Flavobacteriaceae bacterium]|nr:glycoside hydrolase family 13 protein [Flavobacteriaceae bacterium]
MNRIIQSNKVLLTCLFFCFIVSKLTAQIEKVEPPFWWENMQDNNLQLLIYGKNISDLEVRVAEPLKLANLRKTENPNYLFVTLNIEAVSAGEYNIEFLRNGKKVNEQKYSFLKRNPSSRYRKGFDASDVVYLIMPDRFANGDPSNDSHSETVEKVNRENQDGRHGGDIAGIINNLDYIEELGATAIWSTPLLEDNEPIYSYHTYAQSDYYKIDPRYGTNEDYKKLAEAMHQRGMKLIMDYVTNHWGSKHWMIQDLPTKDWIHVWPDDASGFRRSNYRMTTQFDDSAAGIDAEGCMNGWFDTTMPDMNQANPLLLKYMIQNAIWWIEYADLGGLRVDTYSYNDKNAIARWTKAIMDEYPNFNIVGEVWMHDQAQIAFWQKDSPIGAIKNFNSYCPSVMDFTLHDAVVEVFHEEQPSWGQGMIKVYENFTNDFLYADVDNLMVFLGNHDTSRINQIYKDDFDKYRLAFTLIATTRGIPQIYYGDEIGMMGDKDKGDGDIRRDFPGGWNGDKNIAFKANSRTERQQLYFDFTKKILNYRKQTPVLHFGKLLHFIPEDNVYVYFRMDENQSVMVVLNNTNTPKTINPKRFKEGIRKASKGKELFSKKTIDLSKPFNVGAKAPLVIEINYP